jgi:hypothetical protein
MKKAQITIFMFISIIILIFAGVYFLLISNSSTNELNQEENLDISKSVDIFITSCLNDNILKSIFYISKTGGHLNDPLYFDPDDLFNVIVYADGLENKVPNLDYIQKEMSKLLLHETLLCFNDFLEFQKQGYEINNDQPNLSIIISERDLLINLDMMTEITLNEIKQELQFFSTRFNLNYLKYYNISNQIINNYLENNGFLDLVYLEILSQENNFNYDIVPVKQNVYIISLMFSDVRFEFRPLIYNFKIVFEED